MASFWMRVTGTVAVFTWVTSALAQGGQVGGAAGAGNVGDAMEGALVERNHILTPGDVGEWSIEARENETIIAGASSTAFDPAIEVVDEAGKILAQNDDVRPGQQQALVLYRFPKPGSYKVLVKGYKSVAGGLYEFSLRRFVSKEVPVGERAASSLSSKGIDWLRFRAAEGDTLVLSARVAGYAPRLNVFGPTGEGMPLHWERRNDDLRYFRAKVTGEHYLQVEASSSQVGSYAVAVTKANVATTKVGETATGSLQAGGLDIWRFEAQPGQMLRIVAVSKGIPVVLSSQEVMAIGGDPDADEEPEEDARAEKLFVSEKSSASIGLLALTDGTFEVRVSQPLGLSSTYSLSVSRLDQAWPSGTQKGLLPVGEWAYWTFEAKQGELLQIAAVSEQFDASLALYDSQGALVSSNDDGGASRDSLISLTIPKSGRYVLRVGSYGGGGGGSYTIVRERLAVKPIALDTRGEGLVGLGASEVWSFNGSAGQIVLISVRSSEFDTTVRVFGPDGVEVGRASEGGEVTDSLLSLKLPLDGTYTIWVSSRLGSGRYTIRVIDLDG